MGWVSGYMDPFNCYPTCCSDVDDCTDFCFTTSGCGSMNTCSQGSCGNDYAPAYDIAYCFVNRGGGLHCDNTEDCPDYPEIACSTIGTLYDYDLSQSVSFVELTDCGPAGWYGCNLAQMGCMTICLWTHLGYSPTTGGSDYCSFTY